MIQLMRLTILVPAIFLSFGEGRAQTPQRDNRPRTASISGRVTVGGKPAANAMVMVVEVDPQSRDRMFAAPGSASRSLALVKVRAESDGRYHVAGLTEGAYLIRALSKAYVRANNSPGFGAFQSITLDEGEGRENVDIALVRGGVITGRVTDAEGRPLIAGYVQPQPLDENGKPKEEFDFDNWDAMETDDRGVYRLYGLPAGRYLLCAGGAGFYGPANRKYPRTFYPDATDEKQAKIVEVKEGAEVSGIDIRLGVAKQTYEAAGRVVDSETGQPVPQVSVMCVEVADEEDRRERIARTVSADDQGKFQITGLLSGRYLLVLRNNWRESGEHYSDKTEFEMRDSDVSGLEIKAIRGSTISGVVVLEGVNDPAVKAKLPQASVAVQVSGKRDSPGDGPGFGRSIAKIASDGGFRATGAPPGMASFALVGYQENIFSIKRIERNGAEIRTALEIGRGEQITGVRIVLAYANGSVRGQVKIAGGKLPEGWQLRVYAAPVKTTDVNEPYPAFQSGGGFAVVDEKGRFVIERLTAGEYDLRLYPVVRRSHYDWENAPGIEEVKQRVTVSSGAETPVTLDFDPARRRQGK
jgi:hypothetical protein